MKLDIHQRWFWLGCFLEAGQIGLAAVLARKFGLPLFGSVYWNWRDATIGCLASLPLFILLLLILRSPWRPLGKIRQFLETAVATILGKWSVAQLAFVSALAGVGEELLFRAAIQGGLNKWLGLTPGIIGASLLFGLCHRVTWAYAFVAGAMGACLSGLWLLTGNLLTPILTHALYDFLALIYLARKQSKNR